MSSVVKTAIKRSVTVCIVVLIVFAAGIFAARSTPVELLPDISVPVMSVMIVYPGANAASVEKNVTAPIDAALKSVGGADRLQTYSMDNVSSLFFYFDYGTDLEEKEKEVKDALSNIVLPKGCTEPVVSAIDFTANAVATLSVYRDDEDIEKLKNDAIVLKNAIAGIEGVGEVRLVGSPEYAVNVKPQSGFELSTLLLYQTLSMGALDIPLGSLFEDGTPVSVRNVSDAKSIEELGQLPIALTFAPAVWEAFRSLDEQVKSLEAALGKKFTDDEVYEKFKDIPNMPITLTPALIGFMRGIDYSEIIYNSDKTQGKLVVPISKIAQIDRERKYSSYSYFNGKPSITVEVMAASGANTVAISQAVKDKADSVNVKSEILLLDDEAEFINDSISNILSSLLIGGLLAVLVIFLFLRKISLSAIISVTMPLSVLAAIIALHFMGISFNMVSLGGLAVGIGMLVDNSIVVIENITKRRDSGMNAFDSAYNGTKDVAGSLFASTLTTVCVFVPILFITGLTKEAFADLAYAVMFSLTFSLIVALTVIPSLYYLICGKLMHDKRRVRKNKAKEENQPAKEEKPKKRSFAKAEKAYAGVLEKLFNKKALVVVIALVLFVSSIALVFSSGMEFLPSIDKGLIEARVKFGTSVSVDDARDKADKAEQIIKDTVGDNLESTAVRIGALSGFSADVSAEFRIQLKESDDALTKQTADKIRTALNENGEGNVTVTAIDGVVATLTGGFSAMSVSVRADTLAELFEISEKVKDKLPKDKFVQVSDNLTKEASEYQIDIDRTKCSQLGVDYGLVVNTLRTGMASMKAGELSEPAYTSDIIISFGEDAVSSKDNLMNLNIGFSDKGPVKLSDVATVNKAKSPSIIIKENGQFLLQISAQTVGVDTGTAGKILANTVEDVIADYKDASYTEDGVQSYLNDTFDGLLVALIISVFLLYAVMACQFESLLKPLIIMMSIPLAFTGGFLALKLSGITLNVVSFIGIIMLMGVIVNNAIIMIDQISALVKEKGMSYREAIVQGCAGRLRPILMTTLTTVLALIPLSLGLGKGGELMQPMGVVVMGGLIFGTAVTLILIPVILAGFKGIGSRKERKAIKQAKAENTPADEKTE